MPARCAPSGTLSSHACFSPPAPFSPLPSAGSLSWRDWRWASSKATSWSSWPRRPPRRSSLNRRPGIPTGSARVTRAQLPVTVHTLSRPRCRCGSSVCSTCCLGGQQNGPTQKRSHKRQKHLFSLGANWAHRRFRDVLKESTPARVRKLTSRIPPPTYSRSPYSQKRHEVRPARMFVRLRAARGSKGRLPRCRCGMRRAGADRLAPPPISCCVGSTPDDTW